MIVFLLFFWLLVWFIQGVIILGVITLIIGAFKLIFGKDNNNV